MSADNCDRNPRQEQTFTDSEIDQLLTTKEFTIRNGKWSSKDLLALKQCDKESIEKILEDAAYFENLLANNKRMILPNLKGAFIAEIFTQESLRTFSKFSKGAKKLGAFVFEVPKATDTTSYAKDESLEDAMRTLEAQGYEAIITRNKGDDSALAAAIAVEIPIVNAGSGQRDHPSQALQELYTIRREVKKLPEKTIVTVLGDLKNGRTVHSLLEELILMGYKNVIAVSPKDLKLPNYMTKHIEDNSMSLFESENLTKEIIEATDVLYVTRVQKEHGIANHAEIARSYRIDESIFEVNPNIKIMHPLPRNEELSPNVDKHKEAALYWDSAKNGVYVAMSILDNILN